MTFVIWLTAQQVQTCYAIFTENTLTTGSGQCRQTIYIHNAVQESNRSNTVKKVIHARN